MNYDFEKGLDGFSSYFQLIGIDISYDIVYSIQSGKLRPLYVSSLVGGFNRQLKDSDDKIIDLGLMQDGVQKQVEIWLEN